MNLVPRIHLSSIFAFVLACATDPGDVGSGSASNSGSAEGNESSGSAAADGSTTGSASNSTTDSASQTNSTSDGGPMGSEGAGSGSDGAGSSEAGGSGDTGTMVADCSECGPDEGCVAEVAFVTEYFCVPIPQACPGMEFNCDCGSQFCVDPFTICQDLPDPPQRQIACECTTC